MASLWAPLEGLAAAPPKVDTSLSCRLVFVVDGHAPRALTVAAGRVTLAEDSDATPAPDACQLHFSSEEVFASAVSGKDRLKTYRSLATGAMSLKGNVKLLQDARVRPLLVGMRRSRAPSASASMSFVIRGAEQRDDGATVYIVELACAAAPDRALRARKRYSEFVDLKSDVAMLMPEAELAPLPAKRLFHSESVVMERVVMLSDFLQSILRPELGSLLDTPLLPKFLGASATDWEELRAATSAADAAAGASDDDDDGGARGGGGLWGAGHPGGTGQTAASDEVEELQERVQELEEALAALRRREQAKAALSAREQAAKLRSLGWTCFGGVAALLSLYSFYHGGRAKITMCSLAALGAGAVYLHKSRGRIQRLIHGFWVSGVLFVNYRMARNQWKALPDEESEPLWDGLHQACAIYAYENIVELQGWWVKAGQYLSSRADVMPTPYLAELGKLQDSIPARPTAEVVATVRAELGSELAETLLAGLEERAIAAASIAQVHRVTAPGAKGKSWALKVQHKGVDSIMIQDMWQMDVLIKILAFFDPEMDFRPVVEEWCVEARKELDFRVEAQNLTRVKTATEASLRSVVIPAVVPEYTTARVLVMDFCEGFKIKDLPALDAAKVDRGALLWQVTAAFAQQIFVDGCFNADPHPGNILVQVPAPGEPAVPVLLDFGLAKTMTEPERIAFAKMAFAAEESDYQLLLEAFSEMGLVLNRENPMRDMQGIQLLMSDTTTAAKSRAMYRRYGVAAKARRLARKAAAAKSKKEGAAARKNPVDAWPGSLMFFFRTTGLLRGLCSTLEVEQQYLKIMAAAAKRALCGRFPSVVATPPPLLWPHPEGQGDGHHRELQTQLGRILTELHAAGELVGAQVCVFHKGKECASVCCGTLGKVDPRPVQPSTLFNSFSVTKGVVTTALHMLMERVDQKVVTDEYDTKVAALWPEFAAEGKGDCTLQHALCHQAGLQHALPPNMSLSTFKDFDLCAKHLASAKPLWKCGEKVSYHYYTFGWLVGELLRRLDGRTAAASSAEPADGSPRTGRNVDEIVREAIAKPLGIENEFMIGIGASSRGGTGGAAIDPGRLTTLSSAMVAGRNAASRAELEELIKGVEAEAELTAAKGESQGGVLPKLKSEAVAVSELVKSFAGSEYLMDPRIFNDRGLRESVVPAANGHFSARALAKFYAALANAGELDGTRLLSAARTRMVSKEWAKEEGADSLFGGHNSTTRWGLGYHLYPFMEDAEGMSPKRSSTSSDGFGHSGVGGSIAFADPARQLSIAITVNNLEPSRRVAKKVISCVASVLQLGGGYEGFSEP